MKFVVESLSKEGGRAGVLELLSPGSKSWVATMTPFPLLLSKGGCVPHLTAETLTYLESDWGATWPLLAPLASHLGQAPALEKWGRGLSAFCGLPSHPLVVTVQDPSEETRSGYHTNREVSVWSSCNRTGVDTPSYLAMVRNMKPAAFVSLCDGDTPWNCPNKRISKAVSKSLAYLDTTLESLEGDDSMGVIAAVEGGREVKAREKSAKESSSKQGVSGFLLDGFHCNGASGSALDWGEVGEVLVETTRLLPQERPRFYFGCSSPSLTFHLVEAGIDVFDTSYPVMATEEGRALAFNTTFQSSQVARPAEEGETPPLELDLNDECHRMSFEPLVAGCSCHCCRHFTRAYLHHLLKVKEMLAKVLLSLHNLHHYRLFFNNIRIAVKNDQLQAFRKQVLGT